MKKAQGNVLWYVVAMVIAGIVLFILIFGVTSKNQTFSEATKSCAAYNGECKPIAECGLVGLIPSDATCPTEGHVCCPKDA